MSDMKVKWNSVFFLFLLSYKTIKIGSTITMKQLLTPRSLTIIRVLYHQVNQQNKIYSNKWGVICSIIIFLLLGPISNGMLLFDCGYFWCRNKKRDLGPNSPLFSFVFFSRFIRNKLRRAFGWFSNKFSTLIDCLNIKRNLVYESYFRFISNECSQLICFELNMVRICFEH